jgi:hypothetical protein
MSLRRPYLRTQRISSEALLRFEREVLAGLDGTRPKPEVIKGQPIISPGDFPQNIKTYHWIHQDENNSYALVSLTTDHWIYVLATKGQLTKIYIATNYFVLLKNALSNDAYQKYLDDTLISHLD